MLPVKICCILDREEAAMALAHGARSLGLVSQMPTGWGPIDEIRIGDIAQSIPPMVDSVLLSSKHTAAQVIAQLRTTGCNSVQIVDAFPVSGYAEIRQVYPGVRIFQAVHVTGMETLSKAQELAPLVDCLVLDTGGPNGQLGGTGLTHDWSISAEIVRQVDTPVLLAGGLKPHNVVQAIRTVRPYGLDLCTGVRSGENYALDAVKLKAFMDAVASV